MQPILSTSEIYRLDQNHLKRKGISNADFMEYVATQFVTWFEQEGYSFQSKVLVCVGSGNNGGDGLAIARILFDKGYSVDVFTCFSPNSILSPECKKNLSLLPSEVPVYSLDCDHLPDSGILIDAYLGIGRATVLRDEAIKRIAHINSFKGDIISLDLPSGMLADELLLGVAVKADQTVTLGTPKLALLLPEHAKYTGDLVVLAIGIQQEEWEEFSSTALYLTREDLLPLHRKFHRFAHKGDFGKILLVAGSKGKSGAALLAARAAFRTGSGLVTCFIPEEERTAFSAALPEAMCVFEDMQNFSAYDAIGIGPGLGDDQGELLKRVLAATQRPVVLDADALNCLAKDPSCWALIPKGSILTPHRKEFDRLFGPSPNQLERMSKAKACCLTYGVNLVLKGANSLCSLSDGRQVFNSTGSKHMATAGMGDALTGMLTSFLGQGYSPENAVLCGVFHHGLAGELAGTHYLRGTMANDLIEMIPETYRLIGLD